MGEGDGGRGLRLEEAQQLRHGADRGDAGGVVQGAVAVHEHGLDAGGAGALYVRLQLVADVGGVWGVDAGAVEGGSEDERVGLFGADQAGGDGEVDVVVEAEAAGELIAVSVHVGDDAEGEAEGAEALEVGEDVVEEDHTVGDLADALPDAGGEWEVDGGAGRLEDEELVACEEVGAGFR